MKTTRFFSMLIFGSLFLGISTLFAGCTMIGGMQGDGNVLKETRKVTAFDGIEVSGAFDIILKQGAVEEVTVEADANLLPVIRTDVVGGILRIETKKPVRKVTVMKVYVTVKDLKIIDVSGAVDIDTDGMLAVPELRIEASGASDSKLNIEVQNLKLDCSGASKMKFSGSAVNVKMDLSGASDIFGYDLLAESYDIDISGAGNAQINVSKRIRAGISGAGSVKYKGSPSEIDQHVSGAGSIKRVN
ncbi:MAG: head GIN domain-containing protein [Bacteroidales bacterium]|nr:head GIN domain-containing protein [Bacteroidales bacterium]